jgi:hypothetical protein
LGGLIFGFIGSALGIQWSYGVRSLIHKCTSAYAQILALFGVVACALNALFLRETRADVLLAKRAAKLTRDTGRLHVAASSVQDRKLTQMIRTSVMRPLRE